jgi:hypothetical protein
MSQPEQPDHSHSEPTKRGTPRKNAAKLAQAERDEILAFARVMVASQITKGEITRAIVRKYQISPKYAKAFIDTARYRNTPHINKQADQRLADESDFWSGEALVNYYRLMYSFPRARLMGWGNGHR